MPGASDRFLDALAPDEVAHLHARGVVRRYPRGTALFHERKISDRVLLLTEGRVKIASISEDGRESVLAFRGPGEVLGELSAIDGQPRSAGVTAVDPVEALVIPTADFRVFLERSPKAALWILTRLIARLREADRKRAEFGASDTIGRVGRGWSSSPSTTAASSREAACASTSRSRRRSSRAGSAPPARASTRRSTPCAASAGSRPSAARSRC